MIGFSRRLFLKRGSIAVAMAGAAATSMPLAAEVATAPSAAETTTGAGEVPDAVRMGEDLVAHVRDLASGEINLYIGQRQVVLNDPALARALFRATR